MKNDYDVIVVGGGPAGSMAAWAAARKGVSVLLIEKDREIGLPVRCAEGVGARSLQRVLEQDIPPNWIASTITGFRLVAPDDRKVEIFLEEHGYILERKIFDYDLAMMAAGEGAEVVTRAYVHGLILNNGRVTGVKCEIQGEPKEFRSKVVIGADGVESRVGRWAKMDTLCSMPDMESAFQWTLGNIDVNPSLCDFYFGKNWAPGGYFWIFPKSSRQANVGLGVSGAFSRKKSPKKFLEEFTQKYFPGASVLRVTVGGVPCARTLDHIAADGILLAGDAARQVNPMSGGGITTGMWGGRLAGSVAAASIQKGDVSYRSLREYEKQWHDLYGKSHERWHRIKEAVHRLTDKNLNDLVSVIGSLPSNQRTLMNIFKQAFFTQPKLIFDLIKVFSK